VTMDYNIIQADKEYITRWEVASILIDSFDFHFNYDQYNSHLDSFVDSFKSLTNTKKLLSLLF
jgi:archaellum biogenesis ATPase FlaH